MKNIISMDEAKDKIIGKIGTQRRDNYESELKNELIKKEKIMNKDYTRISVLKMLKTRRNKAIAEIRARFVNESIIDSDEKDFNYMMKTANIAGVKRLQNDIDELEFVIKCLKDRKAV